jgi:protein-arginine kinase activator protein McsA
MIDPHNIFKRLRSDCEAERMVAANKLYESFKNGGGHPDDWELYKKGTAPKRKSGSLNNADVRAAKADAAMSEMLRQQEAEGRKRAEAAAEEDRKARAKAEAEATKLRERLNEAKARAKATPDPSERVDLLGGLLSQKTIDKLSAEQIGERMETLFGERETREHNVTAQVDLVIGQLTEALYQRHVTLFGKRKRGSNAPTVSEFLETHAGRSASWCRRCYKAYTIVISDDWKRIEEEEWHGNGSIEGIIKAAADPNRTTVKRVSKVQQRLDALTDVVRRKEWEDAERLVNDWALG